MHIEDPFYLRAHSFIFDFSKHENEFFRALFNAGPMALISTDFRTLGP
jgi:hypothetical protein